MAYLHLNGYAVPVAHGRKLTFEEIAARRGYSQNGFYQFSRNFLGRVWSFQTVLLSGDELAALSAMLNMRGDGWRWPLGSVSPNGVHYIVDDTSQFAWSDNKRVSQTLKSVATLVSAYAADGGRVYDWNGNAYAPFSGCDGAVLVEPGTTNVVSQAIAECTDHTQFTSIGSPTKDNNTDNYWQGSNSVRLVTQAATPASGMKFALTVGAGDYTAGDVLVWSFYVKGTAGGETIRLNANEDTGGGYAFLTQTEYTINASNDAYTKVYLVISTTASTSLGIECNILNPSPYAGGSQTFLIDGIQVEANPTDNYPTAWVSPGSDPWGSGNGIRPDGVLDYDTFLSTYTKGITVSAWVNYQKLSPAANQHIFDGGDGNPRCLLGISTSNFPFWQIAASDGSVLTMNASALSAGIHHIVGTYDPIDATARLYIDGALDASDAVWSGARQKWDVESISGVLSIGSAGTAGANTSPGPIGPVQVYPFAAPASLISGWYNSGADDVPVPGVMPLAAHGEFLGAGEKSVKVYGQARDTITVPHVNETSGLWDDAGGKLSFTLIEAVGQ